MKTFRNFLLLSFFAVVGLGTAAWVIVFTGAAHPLEQPRWPIATVVRSNDSFCPASPSATLPASATAALASLRTDSDYLKLACAAFSRGGANHAARTGDISARIDGPNFTDWTIEQSGSNPLRRIVPSVSMPMPSRKEPRSAVAAIRPSARPAAALVAPLPAELFAPEPRPAATTPLLVRAPDPPLPRPIAANFRAARPVAAPRPSGPMIARFDSPPETAPVASAGFDDGVAGVAYAVPSEPTASQPAKYGDPSTEANWKTQR